MLKADLLNLEVHLSEARENLIQARHGSNLAKRAFLNLLGLEQGTFQVKPNCNTEQLIPADFSFSNRPELKRIKASIEAAEASLRQAQGGYYPTADAFALWIVLHHTTNPQPVFWMKPEGAHYETIAGVMDSAMQRIAANN